MTVIAPQNSAAVTRGRGAPVRPRGRDRPARRGCAAGSATTSRRTPSWPQACSASPCSPGIRWSRASSSASSRTTS
ncbi:hypothetical protein ACFQZ4_16270 [Catellatospora coxensis]